MKLYRVKKGIEKQAGVSLPTNPNQWPTEVVKTLKNQHPYINLSETETKFDILEPQEKRASGYIVVKRQVAIPFSIRPSESVGKPSIDNLDVMFSNGKFAHLNKRAFERAVRDAERAKAVKNINVASNRYIGSLTGDVSPLEYSPYTNQTGISSYASFGLISRVVKHPNDMSGLDNFLGTYRGVGSIAQSIGFNDVLESLRYDTIETDGKLDNSLAQIVKDGAGFKVVFLNGESRLVSPKDLKSMLQEDYVPVVRQVMGRGWCMIRDVPTMKSVDVPIADIKPSVVKDGGYYSLKMISGGMMKAMVCTRVIGFCGKTTAKQVALGEDGSYTPGKAFLGVKTACMPSRSAFFSGNVIEPGAVGCFVDESFSSPMVTPKVKVRHVIMVPNQPNMVIVDCDGETIGLCMLDGIVRPTSIHPNHRVNMGEMPEKSYYVPTHMSFFTVGDKAPVSDAAAMHETFKSEDPRPESRLIKNARRWTLYGETYNGEVVEKDMDDFQTRMKLAEYGADDHVLEKAMKLDEGKSMPLYGLRAQTHEKVASEKRSFGLDYSMLKIAIQEYTEGVDQMAMDPMTREDVENPQVLDSILSLQFVSDDTLEELVESEPMLEEVEDKIAKVLLASRQGERTIDERSASKTLNGLGGVRNSLRSLAIDLEERMK